MDSSKQQIDKDDSHKETDEERILKAIEDLRLLVSEEKNLKVRMDDNFMLRYLRACDYNPKEAFNKMEKFYKFKAKYKDYTTSQPPSKLKSFISQKACNLLDDFGHDGRRIILLHFGNIDTAKNDIRDFGQVVDLYAEMILNEEETQKNGVHVVSDMAGFPLRLFKFFNNRATISYAMREEMRPWKKIDIHLINTSKFVEILMSIVFPFLGAKFKDMIHIHGKNWESLHQSIRPDILSKEHGGVKDKYNLEGTTNYLYENEDKLKELISLGYTDEKI